MKPTLLFFLFCGLCAGFLAAQPTYWQYQFQGNGLRHLGMIPTANGDLITWSTFSQLPLTSAPGNASTQWYVCTKPNGERRWTTMVSAYALFAGNMYAFPRNDGSTGFYANMYGSERDCNNDGQSGTVRWPSYTRLQEQTGEVLTRRELGLRCNNQLTITSSEDAIWILDMNFSMERIKMENGARDLFLNIPHPYDPDDYPPFFPDYNPRYKPSAWGFWNYPDTQPDLVVQQNWEDSVYFVHLGMSEDYTEVISYDTLYRDTLDYDIHYVGVGAPINAYPTADGGRLLAATNTGAFRYSATGELLWGGMGYGAAVPGSDDYVTWSASSSTNGNPLPVYTMRRYDGATRLQVSEYSLQSRTILRSAFSRDGKRFYLMGWFPGNNVTYGAGGPPEVLPTEYYVYSDMMPPVARFTPTLTATPASACQPVADGMLQLQIEDDSLCTDQYRVWLRPAAGQAPLQLLFDQTSAGLWDLPNLPAGAYEVGVLGVGGCRLNRDTVWLTATVEAPQDTAARPIYLLNLAADTLAVALGDTADYLAVSSLPAGVCALEEEFELAASDYCGQALRWELQYGPLVLTEANGRTRLRAHWGPQADTAVLMATQANGQRAWLRLHHHLRTAAPPQWTVQAPDSVRLLPLSCNTPYTDQRITIRLYDPSGCETTFDPTRLSYHWPSAVQVKWNRLEGNEAVLMTRWSEPGLYPWELRYVTLSGDTLVASGQTSVAPDEPRRGMKGLTYGVSYDQQTPVQDGDTIVLAMPVCDTATVLFKANLKPDCWYYNNSFFPTLEDLTLQPWAFHIPYGSTQRYLLTEEDGLTSLYGRYVPGVLYRPRMIYDGDTLTFYLRIEQLQQPPPQLEFGQPEEYCCTGGVLSCRASIPYAFTLRDACGQPPLSLTIALRRGPNGPVVGLPVNAWTHDGQGHYEILPWPAPPGEYTYLINALSDGMLLNFTLPFVVRSCQPGPQTPPTDSLDVTWISPWPQPADAVPALVLLPPRPNPSNGYCALHYFVPTDGWVTLTIASPDGKQVYQTRQWLAAGWQQTQLSPKDLPAHGFYFCELRTGDATARQKLLVVD